MQIAIVVVILPDFLSRAKFHFISCDIVCLSPSHDDDLAQKVDEWFYVKFLKEIKIFEISLSFVNHVWRRRPRRHGDLQLHTRIVHNKQALTD